MRFGIRLRVTQINIQSRAGYFVSVSYPVTFLQSEEIISYCTFFFISRVHSHLFCLCMRARLQARTSTKEPPSCSEVAVWCRGISCGVRLPAVPEVIFCSCAQGVCLRRADKAKKKKKSLHLLCGPITPSELFLSFCLWPTVNRKTPAPSRPCREDTNGLPVVHWQFEFPGKYSPPPPPQGSCATAGAQAAALTWVHCLLFHSWACGL